jgi:4a-hydroxytetrahydrobiopterin dehydratase
VSVSDLQLLNTEELESALRSIPGWRLIDGQICKSLECSDFAEAFSLMCRIAMFAEKLDHHPEWSNVYNKIHIKLSTHDAGGITRKDIQLAGLIDALRVNS